VTFLLLVVPVISVACIVYGWLENAIAEEMK
jgi:hypothetical protein